jgi:hypothetical protein
MQKRLVEVINFSEEVRKEREIGQMIVKSLRLRLLERCSKIKELIGISFDYSYVFDHSVFNRRSSGHILGVTDSIVDKFR